MPIVNKNHGGRTDGHPATSDTLEYSDEEREFIKAIDRFKRENRRPFPTCSEVLQVAKSLGYRRVLPNDADEPIVLTLE